MQTPAQLLELIPTLPKIELHVHLLGTVRKATFESLVRDAKAPNAPITQSEIDAFYTRGEKPVGAIRVLRALDQWLLTKPEHFYRICYEYLQDSAAHRVIHAEYFWNPTGTQQHSGLAYAQVLPALLRAMQDAQRDFGISSRLIPSIDREQSEELAFDMLHQMLAARCDEVPGIGMDYREENHPPEKFARVYAQARAAGLRTTAHAGEFGMPFANVDTALKHLQVDRIDHGYTIIDSPELLAWAKERGTVFTVAPTNSYYLRTLTSERWTQDHPIRTMLAAGLKLHPNTDDPTLHHVDPTQAWQMMVQHFGATAQDLWGFMHNGLEACWVDESTRKGFLKQIRAHAAVFIQ